MCVFHPNLLKIELHRGLAWLNLKHFDDDFIWLNTKKVAIAGVETTVPSPEAEFLLNVAHIIYKHPLLTMFDFLHLTSCADLVLQWDAVLYQTKKYGWSGAFIRFMKALNSIYRELYGYFPDWIEIPQIKCERITFPYFFSIRFVIETLWERISVRSLINELTLYYTFALGRYYFFGRRRIPYYPNWFPVDKIDFRTLSK